MKKSLLLIMVIALTLIPTASAMAQGDDPVSPACDPAFVLSDLQFMLEDVENFEDFVEVLSVGGFVVADCFDDWLMLLMEFVMEDFGAGMSPLPAPEEDSASSDDAVASEAPVEAGSLTARDAEEALRAAFFGDIELANQYLCPSEHMEAGDGASFPEDLVINELSCERLGDEMNCTFSVTSEAIGGDLEDELTFEIVDELLCTTLE